MKPILCSTLLLAACAAEVPPPAPTNDPPDSIAAGRTDEEEQGRYLLGRYADALASGNSHAFVENIAYKNGFAVNVSVSADNLVATLNGAVLTDAQLVGVVFPTGTVPIRIEAVDPMLPDTQQKGYVLSYNDGSGWAPYCDSSLDSHAVPMQGRWTTGRDHNNNTNLISFGCFKGGVAAKCIDWGYSPGTGGPTDSQWRLHQTCSQFAGADYCDEGLAHTRELTPIVIRDTVPGLKPAFTDAPALPTLDPTLTWPPPDDFYVEAAWQYNGPAICLSKLRWAALPPGGFCPTVLPDPRDPDSPASAQYCDDLLATDPTASGGIFLTASLVMDMYSHLWSTASGELLTSVEGYVEDGSAVSTPAGYHLVDATPRYLLLRNLPGSLDPVKDVTPIYLQENTTTGDRVVAPIDSTYLPNHTLVSSGERAEGYLVGAIGPSLVPLNLYVNGTDYVTAISAPPGYSFVTSYDYVLPP